MDKNLIGTLDSEIRHRLYGTLASAFRNMHFMLLLFFVEMMFPTGQCNLQNGTTERKLNGQYIHMGA